MYSFDVPESYSALLNKLLEISSITSSSVLALKGLSKKKKTNHSVPGFKDEWSEQYFADDFMLGIRRTPANKGMRF